MDKIGFKGVLVCNVTTSDPEVNDEWASENEQTFGNEGIGQKNPSIKLAEWMVVSEHRSRGRVRRKGYEVVLMISLSLSQLLLYSYSSISL